jgi:hypothetical protein
MASQRHGGVPGKNNVPGVLMPGEFENGGKDEEER